MKRFLFAVIILSPMFWTACNNAETTTQTAETPTDAAQTVELTQLCFLEVTANELFEMEGKTIQYNDSIYVYLTIDADNNVTGQYDWLPAERDSRRGEVKGKLVEGKIDANCTFYAEGEKYEEPVTFKISDTEVIIMEGGAEVERLPKVDCQ